MTPPLPAGSARLLSNLCFPHRPVIWLAALVLGFAAAVSAQDQPLVPSEASAPIPPPDPLRSSELNRNLAQLANQPLSSDPSDWRDTLQPVFSFIEGIPVTTVEQGAFKYRRARIRLTEEARKSSDEPFRLMKDFDASPERYWGEPVVFHGYLKSLRPIPASGEEETPWHEGSLKLWNEDRTLRLVTRLLPEDLPRGENLNVPAGVVGYMFPLSRDSETQPAPLIVARQLRWLKPALDLRTLVDVKDRNIGLPTEEADAYYRTLLHAKLIDEDALKRLADEFWADRQKQLKRPRPVFVDLFKTFEEDANIYRGRPVTLEGTMRKLRPLTVDPLNDYGLETLYEAWIFAEDSQSNPSVVVFSENPADLPMGDDLSVPVKVTGYVFKMYGYEARDKEHPFRIAPMLLAKSVTKIVFDEPETFPMAWVAVALGLLCVGIVLFVWTSSRKDKQLRERIIRNDEAEEPPRFENLTNE